MRSMATVMGLFGATTLAVLGCSSGTKNGETADAGGDSAVSETPIVGSGVDCDVENILIQRCESCHGTTPTYGSPMPLVTFNDLMAPAKTDPTRKVIDLVLERVQSTDKPMPPPIATPLTSAEIATLQAWADSGYPQGACDLPGNQGDPYGAAATCTTNKHWTGANFGSALMHPGGACIDCHASKTQAPTFTVGGTAFKTAHEPDDCNGYNGVNAATVVVTDAAGKTISIPVNAVGNFYEQASLKMPIHAKIVAKNGRERVMAQAQTTGDCNACHTATGTKNAPGRIMVP